MLLSIQNAMLTSFEFELKRTLGKLHVSLGPKLKAMLRNI
jgi:hypothetical protein